MELDHNSKECVPLPSPGRGVTRCYTTGTIAVWNNHAVYLYDEQRLQEKPVVLTTDFIIQQVIISNSSAVCIDSNGIAHTVPLKFKSKSNKHFKIPFKPKDQGILSCCQVSGDIAISILRHDDLLLCVHRLNTEFRTMKKYIIEINADMKDQRGNIILKASEQNLDQNVANKLFNKQVGNGGECVLALFSIDKYTIYGQVINLKDTEDTIVPVKLFVCPSEIADIEATNMRGLKIIIGLKSGTIVFLSCSDSKLEAKIIHLNAAIYKMILIGSNIMYTDGLKMWTTDLFSENSTIYKQVFVTQPKYLYRNENRVLCITFANILYNFSLDTGDIYLKQKPTEDGFEVVPRNFTTTKQIVAEMMKEVQRNEEILKKIKLENTLMTAVALSRQSKILDKHITFTTHIYDCYQHVSEHVSATLTRPVRDYFEPNTVLLLIRLQTSSEFRQTFNEICSCLSDSIQLLISASCGKESETIAIPLDYKMYENFSWLIPVRSEENPLRMELSMKIFSPISGPVDSTHNFWIILCSRQTTLNAEHFIKTDEDFKTRGNHKCVKKPEEIVMEIAKRNHGALYDFEIPQKKINSKEWSCYLKLPEDFQKNICDKNMYAKTLNGHISEYLSNKFASPEFHKGNQCLYITVSEHKVALQITSEDVGSVLKISGCDVGVVFELRQYFSSLLYDHTREGSELIAQNLYTRTESLRRKLREQLTTGGDTAAMLDIAHQFHRHSLGALPL